MKTFISFALTSFFSPLWGKEMMEKFFIKPDFDVEFNFKKADFCSGCKNTQVAA